MNNTTNNSKIHKSTRGELNSSLVTYLAHDSKEL